LTPPAVVVPWKPSPVNATADHRRVVEVITAIRGKASEKKSHLYILAKNIINNLIIEGYYKF
jgi:hypothetical protein